MPNNTIHNPQWFNDDDNEFRELLDFTCQEHKHKQELMQLRIEMQIAYDQSQRVLPQQYKIGQKHHEKHKYSRVNDNDNQKTTHTPPQIQPFPRASYDMHTSWPDITRFQVDEFLSVLGEELSQQIENGHLSDNEIMPEPLRKRTS